jgi:hypothetical protein
VGITGSDVRLPFTTSSTSDATQPVPRGCVTCTQEVSALRPLAGASSPPGSVTTMSKSVLGPPRTFDPPGTARTTTPSRAGVLVAVGVRVPLGEAPAVGVPRVAVIAPAGVPVGVPVAVPVACATGRGLPSSGSSASRTI